MSKAMAQQRLHYGIAWEDVTADARAARATLRPKVSDTMSQAKQALLQLRKAQGEVAPVFESAAKAAADGDSDDDDDDDEIMIVQAPKKEIELVEIDDDESLLPLMSACSESPRAGADGDVLPRCQGANPCCTSNRRGGDAAVRKGFEVVGGLLRPRVFRVARSFIP